MFCMSILLPFCLSLDIARHALSVGLITGFILPGIVPVARVSPRLRHEPLTIAHETGYAEFGVDDLWHPTHFYQGHFKKQDDVVVEQKSGLMWQASGSEHWMTYPEARSYIDRLNRTRFAGYNDWRLPTVAELMTLQEAEKQASELCLNPAFDPTQTWSWTADSRAEGGAWYVDYYFCTVFWSGFDNVSYVRAVRP